MKREIKPAVVFLAVVLLFLPPVRLSRGEDRAEAEDWTVVTCDGNLLMDYEKQLVYFFNNVLARNPRGTIRSDRLIVFFSPDGRSVEKTEGEGNVRFEADGRTGRGERMIYYPAEKKTVLIGEASVSFGGDTVRGGMITFYLDKMEMEVEDSPSLEYHPEGDFQIGL